MTPEKLTRLNRILGDKMGLVPRGAFVGQPMFQWKRSEDLMYLMRTGTRIREHESSLLSVVEYEPICEWKRQRKEDGWVLARWIEPLPPEEWEQLYGSSLGYANDGIWFSIAPLRPGVEPDEEFCELCANQVDWQKSLGYEDTLKLMIERREKKEQHENAEIAALLEDTFVYHVPGARGGSYSAPFTKFDR